MRIQGSQISIKAEHLFERHTELDFVDQCIYSFWSILFLLKIASKLVKKLLIYSKKALEIL